MTARPVLVWALLLGLLVPAARALAQRFTASPITLRLEGFVGALPTGQVPLATWVVRVQGKEYTLQVMRLEVLRGNTAYFNVIAALEPYTYAFTVYGHDEALRTLTQVPPQQALAIIGTAQLAQLPGLLFINSIEMMPAPTPVTSSALTLPSAARRRRAGEDTDPSQKSGQVNAAPGVLSCASLQRGRGEGEGTSCRRYRIPLPLCVLATLR